MNSVSMSVAYSRSTVVVVRSRSTNFTPTLPDGAPGDCEQPSPLPVKGGEHLAATRASGEAARAPGEVPRAPAISSTGLAISSTPFDFTGLAWRLDAPASSCECERPPSGDATWTHPRGDCHSQLAWLACDAGLVGMGAGPNACTAGEQFVPYGGEVLGPTGGGLYAATGDSCARSGGGGDAYAYCGWGCGEGWGCECE